MAEDWVSITEAAGRLTAAGDRIDRPGLSRYLKQHAEALTTRRVGKENLVEYAALVAHRRENIRVRPPVPVAESPARAAGRIGARFSGTQADAAARDKMAVAEMREMELAQRKGQLTVVAEVDEAGRNAVVLMTAALDRAVETTAADLSVRYGWDERQCRKALKEFAKIGVDQFHRDVLGLIDQIRRIQADGSAERVGEGAALQ